MRFLLFILFFIGFCAKEILGQERYIDSLKAVYSKNENIWSDSAKVDFLNRVFFHYVFSQSDSAYLYSQKVFNLAKKIEYQKGLALYYNNLGILHRVEGSFEDGLESMILSLSINERIKDSIGIANNYVNMGLIYQAQKKYDIALEYYQKCLTLKTKRKDTVGMAYCMRDMGGLYIQQKNYPKAKEIFEKVIQLKSRPPITFGAIKDLAIIAFNEKNYQKSKEYLENCISGMLLHDKFNVPQAYIHLAKIAQIERKPKIAIDYFDNALKYAIQYKNNQQEKDTYFELFNFFKIERDFERATFYLEAYTRLQDKIFNVETTTQLHRIQNNYALKKQETRANLLEKTQETQKERNRWIAFLVMLVIMAVVIFTQILWQKNKTKKHLIQLLQQKTHDLEEKNEEINQQKEEISSFNDSLSQRVAEKTQALSVALENITSQNKELERFSFIVSHNLSAPVKRFVGLLSIVEKEKITSDFNKNVMQRLEENAQELDNLMLDLDKILSIKDEAQLAQKENVLVKNVINQTISLLNKEIEQSRITFLSHINENHFVYAIRYYLENILFNILENAIKFRDISRHSVVHISLHETENDTKIIIQDNGVGIDLENEDIYKVFGVYQRMNNKTEGKGLGLYLVKTQMETMNGKMEIISQKGQGSTFRLVFPKK